MISLWGARGVATSVQTAMNTVWAVPFARRPGFLPSVGRSFGLLTMIGLAVIVTGLLSGIGSAANALGWTLRITAFVASTVLSAVIFLLAFRLATARDITVRDMIRSAIASAVVWQLLLTSGTLLITHQVRHAQELYGALGVVLGLLAWLHLQAQLMLYAVEADVVRARKLGPAACPSPHSPTPISAPTAPTPRPPAADHPTNNTSTSPSHDSDHGRNALSGRGEIGRR